MGQYRAEYRVGQVGQNGRPQFTEIDRRPRPVEMDSAFAAARRAGLWRFDDRRRPSP